MNFTIVNTSENGSSYVRLYTGATEISMVIGESGPYSYYQVPRDDSVSGHGTAYVGSTIMAHWGTSLATIDTHIDTVKTGFADGDNVTIYIGGA